MFKWEMKRVQKARQIANEREREWANWQMMLKRKEKAKSSNHKVIQFIHYVLISFQFQFLIYLWEEEKKNSKI